MYLSDQQILDLFRKDSYKAMVELYGQYYRPLVIFAERYLRDLAMAEDLVQDFFLRLMEDDYLNKIAAASLSSFLYLSVKNRCFNRIEKNDVLRNRVEIASIDIPVELIADINEEKINRVMHEIHQLPTRTQQAIECILIRGLKYHEAATELGISINTIKYLMKEGLKKLRERLSAMGPEILFFFLVKYQRRV